MADYELMVPLSRMGDEGMRAKDLAAEVCWDKSRLSKQLSRMAVRGLVDRRPADDDARGIVVALTPDARRLMAAVAPAHVDLVREVFFSGMTEVEAQALRSLSRRVVADVEDAAG